MTRPEYRIGYLPPVTLSGGDETLHFKIDGRKQGVSIRIDHLSRTLVTDLPDEVLDLIEIAALVYAVDASVSRGGPTDRRLAEAWYRQFVLEVPVRNHRLWADPEVKHDLEETLMFLSGDRFRFNFVPTDAPSLEMNRVFNFGEDDGWKPDTVMLFSGGLDSFAGALEEVIERRNSVALVSHFSSTKLAPVQRMLAGSIAEKLGRDRVRHIPVRVQLTAGTNNEGTHRTRSFLFAVLGMVTAEAFGKNSISFYENGVVSLNLPPVGNVLNTRATRTTHPQTLGRFEGLFSRIFGGARRVDNPFFWRTKTEVVGTIDRLGMADRIRYTRSCADVRNQTRLHPHCGRCSQCIDRRFAMLAAGIAAQDPAEAYGCDLMEGVRSTAQDKETALSFVRNALAFETMTPVEVERHFPEILNAVEHTGESTKESLPRLTGLLSRHGKSVVDVIRGVLDGRKPDKFPPDSLPWLYGNFQSTAAMAASPLQAAINPAPAAEETEAFVLAFDRNRKKLLIDGVSEIKGAAYGLLIALADEHLNGAGQGLELLDYPMLSAQRLCDVLKLSDREAVRKRINRTRNHLSRKLESARRGGDVGHRIIENSPWHGYRLNPNQVVVRLVGGP